MIETEVSPDRVILVGVQTDELGEDKFNYLMEEMVRLTETAGGEIVGEVTQKLPRPNNKTVIGKGKLEALAAQVELEEANLVIFLNSMSPNVNRTIEEELGVRVIDRVQLILDIFAMRAKSSAGKLQVELAQYEYLLPRITGQGTSLSRLGGGIGTRGPGETKLETDRRHIRSRIGRIKKELKQLKAHRERTRERRQSGRDFNIGFVGYTNAGKSTLLEGLTDSKTYVQDQLFATLDPLTRKMTIRGHNTFTLTDTVGFIEELPTELIYAFKSTLEEIRDVDLLVHVVDASHPARDMHEDTVMNLLRELKMDKIPMLVVYNKKDRLNKDLFTPTLHPSILISAYSNSDLHRLKELIWQSCIELAESYTVSVQPEESDLLALYHQKTLVESLEFDEVKECYIVKGYRRTNHK